MNLIPLKIIGSKRFELIYQSDLIRIIISVCMSGNGHERMQPHYSEHTSQQPWTFNVMEFYLSQIRDYKVFPYKRTTKRNLTFSMNKFIVLLLLTNYMYVPWQRTLCNGTSHSNTLWIRKPLQQGYSFLSYKNTYISCKSTTSAWRTLRASSKLSTEISYISPILFNILSLLIVKSFENYWYLQ